MRAMPAPVTAPAHVDELDEATHRLVRAVDGLTDEQYAEPSLLPGWTRAHVVAHLALNAEALTGVLRSLAEAETGAMYASPQARDTAITDLAAEEPEALRERLLASGQVLLEAVAGLPEEAWAGGFRRAEGSFEVLPATEVVGMRHREVEIHHADLAVGHGPQAWPSGFAERAVESLRVRAPTATLLATDLGRAWHAEPAEVTVNGSAADLAWWLSGRGAGEGLTSNGGDLPRIEEW